MPNWRTYEEVARFLLDEFCDHFGLDRVEAKTTIRGESTDWELDAVGVRVGEGEAIVVVECRRHTRKRISQEQVAGLAFRVQDTGAEGGIIVSPLGLQEGASRVAAAKGIVSVQLNPDCTSTEYMMQFLNKVILGFSESVAIHESFSLVARSKDGLIIARIDD